MIDNAYVTHEREDEWDGDAENEPSSATREWLDARFSSRLADIAEEAAEELEWARALMEEDEEPIYELKPGMVRCLHRMRHTGNQCQLAAGHVGRHAWEPARVERVAEIEAASDKFIERDEAPLVKPQPPSVKAGCIDI